MKIVKEEDVTAESLFNFTKLIKTNYDLGKPLPKELIDSIDMKEVSSKDFYISHKKTSFNYEVKESLLLNITTNLELKYYKEYFNINWINSEDNYKKSFISNALYRGNIELIKEYLIFSESELDKMNIEEQRYYFKQVLEPILNIVDVLNYANGRNNKINIDSYKNVFEISLLQYYKLSKSIYSYIDQLDDINMWFYNYKETPQHFLFGKPEQLIELILKNSNSFNFYKEINKQYKNKNNNPLINETSLNIAIKNFNLLVIEDLLKKMNVQLDIIENEIIKNIESFSNNLVDSLDSKSNNYRYENSENNLITTKILDIIEKYIDPSKIIKKDTLFLNTDKNSIIKFNKLFPNFLSENIIENLNVEELIQSKEYFSEFLVKNNLTICYIYDENQYPSYNLFFANHLSEKFSNEGIDLTNEQKNKIFSFIETKYLPLIRQNKDKDQNKTFSNEEQLIIFNQFKLEHLLIKEKDNIKIKKIKI